MRRAAEASASTDRIETTSRSVHLFTYVVGSALVWTLWGAVSVSAERWYWWPVAPFAGWMLVLILDLWHVYGSVRS